VLPPADVTSPDAADEVLGEIGTQVARFEDTLLDIALANDVGFLEIAAANQGVDVWLPGAGTRVVLPQARILPNGPREGLLLNLSEQRIFLFRNGRLIESYPVGVFRDGFSTPLGSTKIVRKMVDPTWYPPESARRDDPELPAVVPPGPDNPLGTRAMYLGWPRYLIHGTHKPYGVGRRVSRGCIRMYPADAEALYDQVPVGTPVHVVNQPVKVGWWRGELFLQAHPTVEQGVALEETGRIEPVEVPDTRDKIASKAGNAIDRVDWQAVERALRERRGLPVQITNTGVPVVEVPMAATPPPAGTVKTASAPLAGGR
jgi:L,D-transpeptidase ErfK/SrfK